MDYQIQFEHLLLGGTETYYQQSVREQFQPGIRLAEVWRPLVLPPT